MPSKDNASPRARLPMERMMRIHAEIKSGSFPNAAQMARTLEVSSKSVHRDLEFMRDRLGLPLEFEPARNGYCYTEEVGNFPAMEMTEGELFALLVAEKALQQYRGTPFERPLISAFKKMSAALPDTVSLHISEWEQTISFRTSAEPILNLQTFDVLARATARREQLELEYRKPGQARTERRVVDPYHLANINGEWFLFAHCHLRKDIRTFVPARMRSIRATGQTFSRPTRFSLEKRLRDSFGVHSAQGEFNVVVRFNELVADYIREKKWHPSQQLAELPEGGVELRLKLSSLVEVQRWVLSWGADAEVLEPVALREAILAAARKLAGRAEP